ncbi:MAG TPA: hypothetical protein VKA25_03710, partial [Gemmatimonadales bacterium]|nr:hypothetical protein [Gemmatimonadales bacterium]
MKHLDQPEARWGLCALRRSGTASSLPFGKAWARIVDVLGTDLRSLALFRILLATIVLIDLAGRAADLRVHYSDEGVLP